MFFVSVFTCISVLADSGIYVDVAFFEANRTVTVPTLKNSGFTYAILFNINVRANGDLAYNGEIVCSNGQYVYASAQPNFATDVAALRTSFSTIRRVEFCIGGWLNESYDQIKALVNDQGTGPSSILYKNFQALKNAIPAIEAINNDEEQCYDLTTAVAFHVMLYDLGYKTTLAPYTQRTFWQNFVKNVNDLRPGAVDRIDLQCYSGGAQNATNVNSWDMGVKMTAGLETYTANAVTAIPNQYITWKNTTSITGGFYWTYDQNSYNLRTFASYINNLFTEGTMLNTGKMRAHATIYPEKNYAGEGVNFEAGKYDSIAIRLQNIAGAIYSVKLNEGFAIELYPEDKQQGEPITVVQNANDLSLAEAENAVSWRVTPQVDESLKNREVFIKNRKSGLFFSLANNVPTAGTLIQQKLFSGDQYQRWRFRSVNSGAYRMLNGMTYFGVQIRNASNDEFANLEQNAYNAEPYQEFVVFPNDNFHKLIPLNSMEYVSVKDENLANANVVQSGDGSNLSAQWQILSPNEAMKPHVVLFPECNFGGQGLNVEVGNYNATAMEAFGFIRNTLSSVKVTDGFQITLYSEDNFSGDQLVLTTDNPCLDDFDNKAVSISIKPSGATIDDDTYCIQNKKSGLFMSLDVESDINELKIVQKEYSASAYQHWRFVDSGNSLYQLKNEQTGKIVEIAEITGGSVLQQNDNTNLPKQEFLLTPVLDGFYRFVSFETGLTAEGKQEGENTDIIQSSNTDLASEWKLIKLSAMNSISEIKQGIKIYPVPVNDFLYIDCSGYNINHIQVLDLQGKVVLNTYENKNFINVSGLHEGTYIIKIVMEESNTPFIQKFIKQK